MTPNDTPRLRLKPRILPDEAPPPAGPNATAPTSNPTAPIAAPAGAVRLAPAPAAVRPAVPVEPPPLPEAGGPTAEPDGRRVQLAALGIGLAGVVVFLAVGSIAYPRLLAQTAELAAAEQKLAVDREPQSQNPPESAQAEPADTDANTGEHETATSAVPEPSRSPTGAPVPPPSEAVAAATSADSSSPDAKAWITQLRINGVRAGENPRLLVGSKAFSRGEVVNAELGLTFDGYDPRRHMVRFRDPSGKVYERRDR